VLSYTTYFFQLAGVPNPFLGNVIVKTLQLSAQIVSFYNIEKFGRRPLLLVGGMGMMLMNLAIAIVGTIPNWQIPGGLVVALFCIWTWSYSSSCAPIGYCYLAEISTPRLRAKTAGFAAACTACVG
jgi:MFS family permease